MRPTDRPLLACSLPSSGDLPSEWQCTPPCDPEEDGPSLLLFVTPPPAESFGNQVGRLTFIFLSSSGLEAHTTLRNGCRCHRHCDFWCVVWSHGICGIQTSGRASRKAIYGLNSGILLSTILHLPYPNRGVVWRSVRSVFTRLFTPLVLLFRPSRICASVCPVLSAHGQDVDCFFPPTGCKSTTGAP